MTPSLTERVAEEIRVVMTRRRIKQSELARALKKSEQWVSVRLRGAQPIDLNDLQMIAEVLNVEAGDLLPRSNEGRVITSAGSPNHGYAPTAERARRAPRRTSAKRRAPHTHPTGRPETSTATPTPAGPPTQRRATLVAHRPGN